MMRITSACSRTVPLATQVKRPLMRGVMSARVVGFIEAIEALRRSPEGAVIVNCEQLKRNSSTQKAFMSRLSDQGYQAKHIPKLEKTDRKGLINVLQEFFFTATNNDKTEDLTHKFIKLLESEYCFEEIFLMLDSSEPELQLYLVLQSRDSRTLIKLFCCDD